MHTLYYTCTGLFLAKHSSVAARLSCRGKQCVCSCSPVCGGGGGGGAGGGAGVGPLTPEEAPGSRPPGQRTLWGVASRAAVAEQLCALPHNLSPLSGAPAAPLPPQTHLHQAGVLGGGRVVRDVHNLRHEQGATVHGH